MLERAKSFILRSRKKEPIELDESAHLRRKIDFNKLQNSNPNIYASLRITNPNLDNRKLKTSTPNQTCISLTNNNIKTCSLEDVTLRNTSTLEKISRHSIQTNLSTNEAQLRQKKLDNPRRNNCVSADYWQQKPVMMRESISKPNDVHSSQENVKSSCEDFGTKSELLKTRLASRQDDPKYSSLRNGSTKKNRYSGGDFILHPNLYEFNETKTSTPKNSAENISEKANFSGSRPELNNNDTEVVLNTKNSQSYCNSLQYYHRPAPKMGTRALLVKSPKNPLVEKAREESMKRDIALLRDVSKSIENNGSDYVFIRNEHRTRRSLQDRNSKDSVKPEDRRKFFVKSKSFMMKPTKGLQSMLQS